MGSSEVVGSDLVRKPVVAPGKDVGGNLEGKDWVDWEDKIFEDAVPLVSFIRMILHSGTYESGDRLSGEHERTILERLLPYHPAFEKKIGCGIDHIEIGYHPDFESSRCLFIVRKDGQLVDFSYWKCIKGLIRKNYPLYPETFILAQEKPTLMKSYASITINPGFESTAVDAASSAGLGRISSKLVCKTN